MFFLGTHFKQFQSFKRLHLDYSGIIYDQPNNKTFPVKLEAVQYNAAFDDLKMINVEILKLSETTFIDLLSIWRRKF